VLKGIEMLVKHLSMPIIVKEIGAGISADVALRLVNAGVTCIDVAGAGGTSWAGVEILRRKESKEIQEQRNPFWDWGIPTAQALTEVAAFKKQFPNLKIISSGGITNGIDCAKSVALGADLCASARPMLKALMSGGKKSLREKIDRVILECKGAMFLTGCASISELQRRNPIQKILP
jgi:isopentenyl-diphosphate delta-isomerase